MSILVGLHHATRYSYDKPISLGPQIVRLRPAPHCRTRIPSYSLKVTPAQHFVNWQQDPHGNWLARFVFPEKTTEFSITVDLLADLEVINPFDFFVEPYADKWPFKFPVELHEDLVAYVEPEPAGPRLKEFHRHDPAHAAQHRRFSCRAESAGACRRSAISSAWSQASRRPRKRWNPAPALAAISAWLLVQILRRIGLPARFVSGYLIQLRPGREAA